MRRAANQSGSVQPPLSLRQADMAAEDEAESQMIEEKVTVNAVSGGNGRIAPTLAPSISPSLITQPAPTADETDIAEKSDTMHSNEKIDMEPPPVNTAADKKEEATMTSASLASVTGMPLQQLQIVRLLTDLGDRLRQSEKEREILWKEVDTCRKMIAEMEGRGDKTEKAFLTLENHYQQGEDVVKNLLNKQAALEQKIQEQNKELEDARKSQDKLLEKVSSVETAAGSAMVRVEDAITENAKLSKRLEVLGQDKARLIHKLETMEDVLNQTQESLKAKALVLLTDQALATRTQLPQTPAWTGNDTLKMARVAAGVDTKAENDAANPAATLSASLANNTRNWNVSVNTLLLGAIVITGILGGVLLFNSMNKKPSAAVAPTNDQSSEPAAVSDAPQGQSQAKQEKLMAQIAEMANDIEPGALDSGEKTAPEPANNAAVITDSAGSSADAATIIDDESELPAQFAKAQEAQDKAVADFDAEEWTGTAAERVKPDRKLPAAVKEIEEKALADNAVAQHDMAVIYTSGQGGVPINYGRAQKWFLEAAHNGIANAQYNLGVLYHQGIGVQKDIPRAVQLYRVAAANNHPEALYNLAIAYIEGVGTESDPQIANVYFQRAAAGGVAEAAYNLGLLHENGLLGESQPDEALFWYYIAANKDNADAAKSLAQLKKQLSMNDTDVERVVGRVAKQKPDFVGKDGKIGLPEPKANDELHSELDNLGVANDVAAAVTKPLAPAVAIDAKANETAASILRVNPPAAPAAGRAAVISQVEEQLVRLGYYMGVPNGRMTAQLEKSIKAYQKENGMAMDGRATNDLLAHMLASGVEQQAAE